MRNLFVPLLLIILTGSVCAQPLPLKLNHTIIIDTDGAIDDMRAISYLLARPEITIKAILLSDGSLPPVESAEKAASLLKEFDIDSIPLACGTSLKGINPPWRQFNSQINWGNEPVKLISALNAAEYLSGCLKKGDEKIILVCLGPLTNIAQLIAKEPELAEGVERMIWYNESVKPLKGFNYECDPGSAETVFKSGVRIDVISNLKKSDALFDSDFYILCGQSKTKLATVLFKVHSQITVLKKLQQNHFRLSDDLVALYLMNPELVQYQYNDRKVKYKVW